MPNEFSRTERLSAQIHRALSVIISQQLKDPRVGMITVSEVEVSSDLSYAKIYYTMFGDLGSPEETQVGLKQAGGFLRSQLSKVLTTRSTPELKFIYDDTPERGDHMEALIARARARDRNL